MSFLRNVCFTLNNYTQDDEIRILNLADNGKVTYIICAREIGESGTPHLQGYCELSRQQRFEAVKALIGSNAHIERREGPQARAIAYIKKGTQPHDEWDADHENGYHYGADLDLLCEDGEPKTQGRRSDLGGVVESIAGGKRLREVAEEHPEVYIKYHKGIQDYHAKHIQPRSAAIPKAVFVRIGETGTGKTKFAFEQYPEAYMFGPENGKWWDGYDQHKEVIIDEFRSQLTFSYLLRILDRYPMQVEYKGGMTQFTADTITITSPVHPALWYTNLSGDEGKMQQLRRRITGIYLHESVDTDPTDITDDPWPTQAQVPSQFSD
jgi:hypothetical protein